jgi:hypothetical protein
MKRIAAAIAFSGIALFFSLTCSTGAGTDYPVSIACVKEMAYIPEVDGWEQCAPAGFAADSQKAAAQWDTLCGWVRKQCTPATIRGLSCWAKKQMADYIRTPSLKGLAFTPIRCRQDQKKLVLQAIVDSLPVHDRSVTRYLKLYLLYDTGESAITQVTITIRGELSE